MRSMKANIATIAIIQFINVQLSLQQFDHAFRKFGNYDYEKEDQSQSLLKDIPRQSDFEAKMDKKVMKKVGLAQGENEPEEKRQRRRRKPNGEKEEREEPKHHHQLLRRVGNSFEEDDHDQIAVETTKEKKSTQGLRQFSSGKHGNKFSKIQHKSVNVLDFPKEHRLKLPEVPEFQIPKLPNFEANLPKFSSNSNPYAVVGQKARNFLVIATNTAFQGTTIATYLTQMWTANIIQTIGWALIGAFYSNANRRSFSGRASNDESEVDPDELDSLMSKIDGKTVASLLRGIAEAAEMWHDEL